MQGSRCVCRGARAGAEVSLTEVRRRIEQVGASSSSPLSAEATTLLSSIEHNVRLLDNAARAQRKGHYQPSTAWYERESPVRLERSLTSSAPQCHLFHTHRTFGDFRPHA